MPAHGVPAGFCGATRAGIHSDSIVRVWLLDLVVAVTSVLCAFTQLIENVQT